MWEHFDGYNLTFEVNNVDATPTLEIQNTVEISNSLRNQNINTVIDIDFFHNSDNSGTYIMLESDATGDNYNIYYE